MQYVRSLLFMVLAMLLLGCKEKFPVYSSFCEGNETFTPPCLHYAIYNPKDKAAVENALGIENTPECEYRVELTKYHVSNCDNPVVKSIGSDFDGYIRLEIKKGFICYYKVQSDYKSDADAAFDRILEQCKKELKWQKKLDK